MEHLNGIVKLAEKEFDAIIQNGKFRSREEIDSVYKLMDIVKDAKCIENMEYDDYDMDYDDGMRRSHRDYDGMSYARGRKRDSMGRYSRDYDGRSMRGYSRDSKEDYIDKLHDMMEAAPDEPTRQGIKRMIESMK